MHALELLNFHGKLTVPLHGVVGERWEAGSLAPPHVCQGQKALIVLEEETMVIYSSRVFGRNPALLRLLLPAGFGMT
jgi:hypothetical protein